MNRSLALLDALRASLTVDGAAAAATPVSITGAGDWPSPYPVVDLAAASVALAGVAAADWLGAGGHPGADVAADRRLAALWFARSMAPVGWELPPVWDPVAGDYRTRDGWIRLHTNAPHHRAAALAVLGTPVDRDAVAAAVAGWSGADLESAVVAAGGCSSVQRTAAGWAAHPQGQAVATEPLVAWRRTAAAPARAADAVHPERPLQGIRVLDLTRVLAGPVATRLLAGLGAEVLRIDPPGWDEPGVVVDVALGKRCARLDLKRPDGHATLAALLAGADVLVHGYRADALERLGLGDDIRAGLRPGLVDVALNAWGWSGPWRHRRGFDSLVQMGSGITATGQAARGADHPVPLPVQALDHATGWLMAAAVLRGLALRRRDGHGVQARLSLARTAVLLATAAAGFDADRVPLAAAGDGDWSDGIEASGFGPLRRLRPPLRIGAAGLRWDRPAPQLGSDPARWPG